MRRATPLALLLVVGLTACKSSSSRAGSAASAQASGRTPAAPPQPRPKPWYAGKWTGSYDATHHVIDMTATQGAVPQWDADTGKLASGTGTIALVVDEEGAIHGSSTGPLGELVVSGQADTDALRLRLEPARAATDAFRGFVIAKHEGDGAKGKLSASSGDSLTVREAPVTLDKAK